MYTFASHSNCHIIVTKMWKMGNEFSDMEMEVTRSLRTAEISRSQNLPPSHDKT